MNLPNTYNFIAVFAFVEDGISITFPDLLGCVSFGKDESEAMKCAKEVLMLHLYGMEQDEDDIPAPSSLKTIKNAPLESNELYTMIEVYMPSFRARQSQKFVKKTLSIPCWLNAEAEHYGINFSKTLQTALTEQLQGMK